MPTSFNENSDMKILVVDDDRQIRRILSKVLVNAGYHIITAENGAVAWDIMQKEDISIVITDWMMPEMDGLTLCKKIRSTNFSHYVFIILLTSKEDKDELIEGLDSGADEFLIKPSNKGELKARIRACERILALEKNLEDRNKKLIESNQKLNEAYSVIRKDLQAAAKIQTNLLPKSDVVIHGIQFNWFFLPSTYVAGDTFGYFKLDEHHIGFYLLDVAGHGIPAALLSVTLSNILSPEFNGESILKKRTEVSPFYEIISPATVIHDLNQRFQLLDDNMQYFTIIYGIIDTREGRTRITQAGHPSPIHMSDTGDASLVGDGGFPVGMMRDINYDLIEIVLKKGDRLTLYSDGITECTNSENKQFSTERLINILKRNHKLPTTESIKDIKKHLMKWNGNNVFKDDMTLLTITSI